MTQTVKFGKMRASQDPDRGVNGRPGVLSGTNVPYGSRRTITERLERPYTPSQERTTRGACA